MLITHAHTQKSQQLMLKTTQLVKLLAEMIFNSNMIEMEQGPKININQ